MKEVILVKKNGQKFTQIYDVENDLLNQRDYTSQKPVNEVAIV